MKQTKYKRYIKRGDQLLSMWVPKPLAKEMYAYRKKRVEEYNLTRGKSPDPTG